MPIHALLIALNHYHPTSGVGSLDGCVNDVRDFRTYLTEERGIPKANITVLENEAATRTAVEAAFLDHARRLRTGDRFVLYYAGHGSWDHTAEEFAQTDGLGRDETLVLYDSGLPDHFALADKELAWLLAQFAEGVDIVTIFDSCHSASITRSSVPSGFKNRFDGGSRKTRSLADYRIDGQPIYTGTTVRAPRRAHLTLSAAQRDEEAWETFGRRGLFSTSLLQTLRAAEGPLNYTEVARRTEARMRAERDNQSPYLDAVDASTQRVFLSDEERSGARGQQYAVAYESNEWRMKIGAIHGIPATTQQPLRVQVFSQNDPEVPITTVDVREVSINHCILNAWEGTRGVTYWGVFENLPHPLLFALRGSAELQEQFQRGVAKISRMPNIAFVPDAEDTEADFYLELHNQRMVVTDRFGTERYAADDHAPRHVNQHVTDALGHIERYERTRRLRNPNSELWKENGRNKVEVQLVTHGQQFAPGAVALTVDKTSNGQWSRVPYNFTFSNRSDQTLHVAVLAQFPDFETEVLVAHEEVAAGKQDIFLLPQSEDGKDQKLLGLLESESFITDYFRILVATERFDARLLEQRPLSRGKTRRSFDATPEPLDDWAVIPFDVTITGTTQNVADGDLTRGDFTFKQHPKLTAQLGTQPLASATRSAHGFSHLNALLEAEGALEFVNFSPPASRSANNPARDQRVVELSGLNTTDLADAPLEIAVNEQTEDYFLPVTFDGEFFVPIGQTRTDAATGKKTIEIDRLPEGEKRRSLTRAAWFAVLRTVGFKKETFLLRRVSGFKTKKGKPVAIRDLMSDPKHHVAKADRILLCIHGIIGDAAGIANELQSYYDAGTYDLILTFDYECLMNGIAETAMELHERLTAAGLGKDDGKTFDIVAHSMGGLVSRHLIEHLHHGNNTVDRLIMFGTPNGGSAFGEIPKYRNIVTTLLTVALNYGRFFVGPVAVALDAVNGALAATVPLTKTLGQMAPGSDFLKGLNETADQDRHTEYTVVAGDITQYESLSGDGRFAELMDRLLTGVGRTVYSKDRANDIAVSTDAIQEVRNAATNTVICHHLNYFIHPEGIKHFDAWLTSHRADSI